MNHSYCFDGFWKLKAKYIVLCLNALAKCNMLKLQCLVIDLRVLIAPYSRFY